jgi:hypothetical protein
MKAEMKAEMMAWVMDYLSAASLVEKTADVMVRMLDS